MKSLSADPDGVLLVDKAEGMTSHDVVALTRRKLATSKIGHCGTLDPIARRGPDYAFKFGAKNPKSRYIEVFAGHLTTPLAARSQVVEWINSL